MHALLDGVADDEAVHHRRALLADPVDTTDGLKGKQDQIWVLVLMCCDCFCISMEDDL